MNTKALAASLFLVSSLLATGEALAKHDLTPEQLAKARETASKLNPPVDFDVLMNEADRLGVECTGDLTRGVRIAICEKKINNAKKQENIDKLEADTKATKARKEQIHKENSELIREVQQRIKDNK
ncbi:hypothetical protein FACS189497_14580 [Betaproteobacteria bacterium]|nr:hypothetical protein FACS189497_14580 [Betaproteobacteria bacterium]